MNTEKCQLCGEPSHCDAAAYLPSDDPDVAAHAGLCCICYEKQVSE